MNLRHSFFFVLIFLVFLSQAIYATPTNVSILIAGNAGYTNTATPAMTISATLSADANMQFSCDNSTWSTMEAFSASKTNFDITTGNGCVSGDANKTVYVKVQDATGQATASNSIYFDKTTPSTTASSVSAGWHSSNVDINFSCTDAASGCKTITVNGTPHDGNFVTVTISTEGSNSVTYYSTDVAGNTDTTTPITVQIDKTGPAISNLFPASNGYDGNSSPTIKFDVADAGSGIKAGSIALAIDGTQKTPTANGSTYSFTLDYSINSTKTVKVDVNAKDNSDNNSSSSWTFTVDKTPPTGTITLANIDVNTATPHLTLSASDSQIGMSSGKMKFSCGTTYSTETTYATDYTGFNITSSNDCNSSEGSKTIHVMFADSAGNWSTVDSNVQIVYDITAPAAPTGLTATAGNSQATLNWSASTDSVSGVKDYIIYLNEANHATTSGTSYTVTGLSNGTSYSFRISARDNSGNEGAQAAAVSATPTAPTSSADNPITPATEDDSSPPSIIWVNLQPKQNLSGIFKIQVDAIDASGIKYISMYIDSQDEKGFVEKITSKQGTYFEFSIDTTKFSDENHSLIVVSADNAPNQHTGTSTINVNFANAKNQNNDQENNEQNKPPEKETFFSQTTNFGEKDKNFINGISLEETAKQKAIELLELLKPKRKIEITKDGKKFNLKVTISFENTDLNSIKIVEIIPKEFAKSASEIGSDFNFNVLADDPIIEFDLNSLASNKTIELKYWLKADLNESAAEEIPKNTDGKFSAPIILTTDIIVSKESFNIEMEKNSSPSAFFSLENIGFLPILGAIAILGIIWVFVFSMKHPLKIIHEHAVEKNVSEEKPAETGQGTIAGETEATAKKKKSEQIKELDTVEEKLKGLRKEAN